jgi:hypothetical protein
MNKDPTNCSAKCDKDSILPCHSCYYDYPTHDLIDMLKFHIFLQIARTSNRDINDIPGLDADIEAILARIETKCYMYDRSR